MELIQWTTAMLVLGAGLLPREGGTQEAWLEERLAPVLDEAQRDMGLEAYSVRVGVGGEALFEGSRGVTPDGREEVDSDTAFRAADLADPWLCGLLLRQRERGKLELEATARELLPGLLPEGSPVTVLNLMNHTSGLAEYRDFVDAPERGGQSYASLLASALGQPLSTKPGACVAPTASETQLLAAVLEAVSGEAVAAQLDAGLFEELELVESGYETPRARPTEAAATLDGVAGHLALAPEGLYSGAADLARFARALFGGEWLGEEELELFLQPTRLADGTSASSGLGVRLARVGEDEAYVLGGARAALVYLPAHDLVVSAVGRGEAPRMARLALRLAREAEDTVETEIADLYLSRVDMRPYLGTYSVGCDTLEVRAGDGRLVLSRVEEGEDVLLYQGAHRFVVRGAPGVELTFELSGSQAVALVIEEHGLQTRAIRFE